MAHLEHVRRLARRESTVENRDVARASTIKVLWTKTSLPSRLVVRRMPRTQQLHELGALMTTHRKPSLYVMRLAAHQTVRTDTMPPSRCRHQARNVGD